MDKEIKNTPTCDTCQPCYPNVKIDKIEEGMTGKEVADLLYNNFDKLNKSKANKCVERKVRHLLRGENGIYNETAKNKFIQQVFYTWSKKDYNSTIDYVLNNAPSIEVGTTTTLPAGSQATVTATKDGRDAVLNFGIPKGDKGDKGDQGIKGDSGVQLGDITLSQELGDGEDVTVSQKKITEEINNLSTKPNFLINTDLDKYIKELYIKGIDNSNETFILYALRENTSKDYYQLIFYIQSTSTLLSLNFKKDTMGVVHSANEEYEAWAILQRFDEIIGDKIYQNTNPENGKVANSICADITNSPSIYAYINKNNISELNNSFLDYKKDNFRYVENDVNFVASKYIQELYLEGINKDSTYYIYSLYRSQDNTNVQLVLAEKDSESESIISFVFYTNENKSIVYSARNGISGFCILKNKNEIGSYDIFRNTDSTRYVINNTVCADITNSPSIYAYINKNNISELNNSFLDYKKDNFRYVENDVNFVASKYIQELYLEGINKDSTYYIYSLYRSQDNTNVQLVLAEKDSESESIISFVFYTNENKSIVYSARNGISGFCILKNKNEIGSYDIFRNTDSTRYVINNTVCGNITNSPSIHQYINEIDYINDVRFNKFIKELYIEGLDDDTEYCIKTIGKNSANTYTQVIIGTSEDDYILSFDFKDADGLDIIKESTRSNYHGYIVLNTKFEIYRDVIRDNTDTSVGTINKSIVSNITNSPIIHSYVNIQKAIPNIKTPNIWMPNNIYALKGTDLYIFRCSIAPIRNPESYDLHITGNMSNQESSYGYNRNYYWVYPVGNNSDFDLNFGLKSELGTFTCPNNSHIIHVDKPSSPSENKNVLVIGDSFTDQKYWVSELHRLITGITDTYSDTNSSNIKADSLNNITFIGTKDTENTPNEGYSGKHYAFFASDGSSYGDTNPFWDGSKVNFTWYCNQHSYQKIDFCIIELGTNGYNEDTYVNTVWDALLEHNPNIKVIIMARAFANPWCAGVQGLRLQQEYIQFSESAANVNEYYQNHCNLEKYKNNFLFVDYNTQMDVWNNYHYDMRDANARNSSVQFRNSSDPNDNIHPGKLAYWQMAEAVRPAFYYWCLNSNR